MVNRILSGRRLLCASVTAAVAVASPAQAEPGSAEPIGVMVAAKVGAALPFNGLSPYVSGGIQLGWQLPGFAETLAVYLDISATSPSAEGNETDDRLVGSDYSWHIRQKELILQPTALYRFTSLGDLVPFVGIGPRIYLLSTTSKASAGAGVILESTEQSTKFGVGVPIGVEYSLGPGNVLAEALLEWAPLDHRITGNASLLGANLFVGYRMIF